MSGFHISLEARNPAQGHLRTYSIEAGRDLFGHWIVKICFGRIGRRGPCVIYSTPDESGARRIRHSGLLR